MNNLLDISQMDKFQTLCGFTEKELRNYFSPHIELIATQESCFLYISSC